MENGTMTRLLAILAVFAATLAPAGAAYSHASWGVVTRGPGWVYTRLGNQTDVTTRTTPGIVFEGGGTDVDKVYEWMCQRANGGDFLVIRSRGTADYNPYIMRLCPGINSVATLKITDRAAAHDPFVAQTISQAEALFIAGGDQAQYVRFWQNTPVNTGINALAAKGVPVGGTSAGNAILAQYAFSALAGSVYSRQALDDPFQYRITIDEDFLSLSPLTQKIITDDHFVTRDRMGRLVTFLARISHDHGTARPFGIALDEHTAFMMEADGVGRIVGDSTAYFISTPGRPGKCRPGERLTYRDLTVQRLTAGDTFDVVRWQANGGVTYSLSAVKGQLSSTQPGGGIY
jgi:cyanophycinase